MKRRGWSLVIAFLLGCLAGRLISDYRMVRQGWGPRRLFKPIQVLTLTYGEWRRASFGKGFARWPDCPNCPLTVEVYDDAGESGMIAGQPKPF